MFHSVFVKQKFWKESLQKTVFFNCMDVTSRTYYLLLRIILDFSLKILHNVHKQPAEVCGPLTYWMYRGSRGDTALACLCMARDIWSVYTQSWSTGVRNSLSAPGCSWNHNSSEQLMKNRTHHGSPPTMYTYDKLQTWPKRQSIST